MAPATVMAVTSSTSASWAAGNDGRTNVWYALLEARPDFAVEFVQWNTTTHRLAAEMRVSGCQKSSSRRVDWW